MPKGKRQKKVDDSPTYTSIEQANSELGLLRELDAKIEDIRSRCANERARIDKEEGDETKDLLAEAKTRAKSLELFARWHFDHGGFGELKSLELPAGFIGFRRTSKLKFTMRPVATVIQAMRSVPKNSSLGKKLSAAMTRLIKITEKPVKTEIRALDLSEEELGRIGVKIETDEMVFAFSTDKSKAFDLSEEGNVPTVAD